MSHVVTDQSCSNASADKIAASRFLLIKAWGCGFWSDMEHVIGQLLIAEITGRTPIVYWGKNSLYGSSEDVNAFEQFFLPVSDYSIHDIIRKDYTFFPKLWKSDNLFYEDLQKQSRPFYQLDALLARSEEVLISDCWVPMYLIQAWLQNTTHPAFGLDQDDIYRYIYEKYIKLRPPIIKEIEDFYAVNLLNKHNLAVHVRSTDKIFEIKELDQINKLYYAEIENYLKHNPSAFIFLLTENEQILSEYKSLWKERLIYTDCQRSNDNCAIHYFRERDERRMGIEIIKDTYLAARCDFFIGNAHSNVSVAVRRLKRWPADSIKLFDWTMTVPPEK